MLGTVLWVGACALALIGLVYYLVRRRPHVLPNPDSGDLHPTMIEPLHHGHAHVVAEDPDDADGNGDVR